jgi:lipopolysaccharide/colanic/teichoic acid biosynthesis glycosyltransferase
MNWVERSIAVILILVFSPILVAISFAAFFFQGHPIFFLQERIGRDGAKFKIVKFRTMRNNNVGSQVTSTGDARITPLGKWLRNWKLDEIPQLINIVKGEMTFVGPRPEVPRYVEFYTSEEKKILNWKPGMTDYATLAFRNEEQLMAMSSDPESFYVKEVMPVKIRINLEHGKNRNWINDSKVILRTILVVLKIQEPPHQDEFVKLKEKAKVVI